MNDMNYKIIKNGVFTFDSRYIYERHCHNHFELICVISGQCIISIHNQDIALNKGDCIAIENNIPHKFYVNGINGCKINQLEVLGIDFTAKNNIYKVPNGEIINTCIKNITSYTNDSFYNGYTAELISNELNKISILLKCHYNAPQALYIDDNQLANNIIQYIKKNYCNDFDYENLAKSYGISSRYLRKLVLKNLGLSAIRYQTYLRIEEAKRQLSFSQIKIADIAIKIGYNTIQYFSETFRQHIGLTPGDFRKLNQNKEVQNDKTI